MELSIIRRETTGAVPNQYNESETITKFEIMDGAPVRGETIPIRLFLGGFELTPTFRDVNKKFSTRYYLNLVLVDEENRRYFKQQEITVFRIPERQSLFIFKPPPSTILETTETTTPALAAVLPIKMDRRNEAGRMLCRADEFDPLKVVDMQSLDSVFGYIIDRGKCVFVEQLGGREITQIGDDPEAVVPPHTSPLR
ncbi:hypothetical protein FS837_004018 [Tulasnella sp. UAMH 9824]|nr:hypothetical protein FS837_004018 [Tulasnella sp. UAMH 9824]